jgi:uncharacterized protein YecA (UPF0149 family)
MNAGTSRKQEEIPWQREKTKAPAFETMSKRRRGFPSETHVKKGDRVIGGDKELIEKLGRNDLCPCGSGRRFQEMLFKKRIL